MAATMQRLQRQATPERWQRAAKRALANGIQVRQLAGSGAWIATSGSEVTTAYEVEVVAGVPSGCSCPAGEAGDPVCQHRAAVAVLFGLLDPEPEPPAPVAAMATLQTCPECQGGGVVYVVQCDSFPYPVCPVCEGTGQVTMEGSPKPSPDHRCACHQGRFTMVFDHSGGVVTARLACVGMAGRPSCGYAGPVMSVAEAQLFADLCFARRQLEAAVVPAVA